MTTQNDSIRESVREVYTTYAKNTPVSCCGEDANCGCNNAERLYSIDSLIHLPDTVTGLSLGCGDPVTIAGLKPGETVLDLGSGGGIDCFLAARQVGETGHVIGVDMTPEMLAQANANKARLNAQNVEFRQGYIESLPVEDNSVDIIMSNCVINLSPDKPAVFKEIFRVLKPGGRISVSDIVTEGDFSEAHRADMTRWAECITGAVDIERYMGMMRDAGLVDVAVQDRVEYPVTDEMRSHVGVAPDEPLPQVLSARITARKPQA